MRHHGGLQTEDAEDGSEIESQIALSGAESWSQSYLRLSAWDSFLRILARANIQPRFGDRRADNPEHDVSKRLMN